jgi:hypothetical protein
MKKLDLLFGAGVVGVVFSFVMTVMTAVNLKKEREAAMPAQGLPVPAVPAQTSP